MAKLPYMPFYVADYLRDTRCLSLAARGVWMDLLCALWNAPTRGKKTLTMAGWAGEIGKGLDEVTPLIEELNALEIFTMKRDGNGLVTLMSRRMCRDEKVRELSRKRVSRFRERSHVTHSDTKVKRASNGGESEIILQITEEEEEKKPPAGPRTDEEFWQDLQQNPAYQHINFSVESGKMDAWLALPKNKWRKKTRAFVLNWLNKIEPPMHGPTPVRYRPTKVVL